MKLYLSIFLSIILFIPTFASAESAAKKELMQTIDGLLVILKDESLKGKDELRNDKLWASVKDSFNDSYMTKRVMTAKHWKKMTKKQQAEMKELFTGLIKKSFLNKMSAFSEQEVSITKEDTLSANRIEISGYIMNRTEKIPIGFRMINIKSKWKIYDLLVDNLSQLNHFKRKFSAIISKEGYDGLINQLKEKKSTTDSM